MHNHSTPLVIACKLPALQHVTGYECTKYWLSMQLIVKKIKDYKLEDIQIMWIPLTAYVCIIVQLNINTKVYKTLQLKVHVWPPTTCHRLTDRRPRYRIIRRNSPHLGHLMLLKSNQVSKQTWKLAWQYWDRTIRQPICLLLLPQLLQHKPR